MEPSRRKLPQMGHSVTGRPVVAKLVVRRSSRREKSARRAEVGSSSPFFKVVADRDVGDHDPW
jgi:hypothetical protein